jgi:hypothetical protein
MVLDQGKIITWTEDNKPMMFGTHADITEKRILLQAVFIRHTTTIAMLDNVPEILLLKWIADYHLDKTTMLANYRCSRVEIGKNT